MCFLPQDRTTNHAMHTGLRDNVEISVGSKLRMKHRDHRHQAGDLVTKSMRKSCDPSQLSAIPRMAVACIAAICACALPASGFEAPPVHLSAATFPEWRDSVHMVIVTNPAEDGLEVTLLIEKPKKPDVDWTIYLDLYQGTNIVAHYLKLGDHVLGPDVLALTGARVMGVKAVQSFWLSVSSNSLPQSTLTILQTERHPRLGSGTVYGPMTIQLGDVCNAATGGFRKGKPIFLPKN